MPIGERVISLEKRELEGRLSAARRTPVPNGHVQIRTPVEATRFSGYHLVFSYVPFIFRFCFPPISI